MKCKVGISPKQKVKIKDIYASARKWQKQAKLSGVSLVLQFIHCLGVSTNSMNLGGWKSII